MYVKSEMHTTFWSGNLTERGQLKRPRHRREDNIKMDPKEEGRGNPFQKILTCAGFDPMTIYARSQHTQP